MTVTAEQTALTKAEIDAVHSTIEMELHPCASQERAREIADYVRKVVEKEVLAPAWEPLTPERLEALRGEDGYPEYWLAIEGRSAPEVGRLNCGEFVVYEPGNEHETWVKPSRVTHIIPFITPEMPKA